MAKVILRTASGETVSRRRPFRLLLSCAGRRVELMEAFRRAAAKLRLPLVVYASDVTDLAPAMQLADVASVLPLVSSSSYIPRLLRLVRRHGIDMVVPLIDTELPKLAGAQERLRRVGCLPIISSPKVVRVCRNKRETHQFLTRIGIDTPPTWTLAEVLRLRRHEFPYFLKPCEGSASRGSFRVDSLDELKTLGRRVPDAIVQEFVVGVEHTLDVYTGFDGVPRCVVPRRRIEVRGGEVVKAVVVRDRRMIEVGCRVAEALAECVGVITIQLIRTPDGRLRVIEINPRFGGGAPLAIHAGADFPRWLLQSATGGTPRIRLDGYRDGDVMLRYDESVFVAARSGPTRCVR